MSGLEKHDGDYTGKSGVGKRYLDEYGNFRPISTLPEEKIEEIAANSRKIQAENVKRRLAQSAGVNPVHVEKASDASSESLLKIIEQQSVLINRLEAKIDAVSAPAHVVESKEPVKVEPEKSLTPKQRLQAEATELGIAFTEKDTMKDLEKMIAEESDEVEVIADDDPRFEEKEEDDDL